MSKALDDVAAERQRQMDVEGWSPEHDDGHERFQLASAGAAYALHVYLSSGAYPDPGMPDFWPWRKWDWRPKDARRDLVRSAALIVAEIERLDRAAAWQHE